MIDDTQYGLFLNKVRDLATNDIPQLKAIADEYGYQRHIAECIADNPFFYDEAYFQDTARIVDFVETYMDDTDWQNIDTFLED